MAWSYGPSVRSRESSLSLSVCRSCTLSDQPLTSVGVMASSPYRRQKDVNLMARVIVVRRDHKTLGSSSTHSP